MSKMNAPERSPPPVIVPEETAPSHPPPNQPVPASAVAMTLREALTTPLITFGPYTVHSGLLPPTHLPLPPPDLLLPSAPLYVDYLYSSRLPNSLLSCLRIRLLGEWMNDTSLINKINGLLREFGVAAYGGEMMQALVEGVAGEHREIFVMHVADHAEMFMGRWPEEFKEVIWKCPDVRMEIVEAVLREEEERKNQEKSKRKEEAKKAKEDAKRRESKKPLVSQSTKDKKMILKRTRPASALSSIVEDEN